MSDSATVAVTQKKLVLIDAYSLLFRAFFAGRPLTTSTNRPTGALYGLANMLFTVLNNEKPDAIIVCWDAHGPTLREQEFPAYKAHRPPVDSQLLAQMEPAREMVKAFGIQCEELLGYEADDLIGTMARKGQENDYVVTIFTGDSDQLQLVRDGVTVQITQRGVTDVKVYDTEAVKERYGVLPDRIPDWKALVGDTSDNIPGVPVIGEKTATALLQKWDSLENLLDHVDEVTPPKAQASLKANRDQAHFSKRLATIECDVPEERPIQPYAPTEANWQELREMFKSLEFRSLVTRIPTPQGGQTAPLTTSATFTGQPVLITSSELLSQALAAVKTSGKVALHLNTEAGLPMRVGLKGAAFAASSEVGYYVPVRFDSPSASSALGGLFDAEEKEDETYQATLSELSLLWSDGAIGKVAHNSKVAEIVLERHGAKVSPFQFDTLIAAYLLNAGRATYPLMDLAEHHLGMRLEPDGQLTLGENLAREAACIFALAEPMKQQLVSVEMLSILEQVEMPLVPVLATLEQVGLCLDSPYLVTLSSRMATQLDGLAKEVYTLAGEEFNIGSPKQLQTILFEKLQLPTGKKIKTGFSTGADLLEQLAPKYEIAQKIIDWREISKLKATYTDVLPKMVNPQTGRLHTSLHQTVASTGRLSSSDPNLQNIPIRSEIGREIRQAFVAPPGKVLLSCDYSQVELRILAHITQDPTLIAAFAEDADIHAATAATVFGVPLSEVTSDQRRQAKTINFAVIYGQSGYSLASTLGVDTPTANAWIKDYFAHLPGVQEYVDKTTALAHEQKFVTTLLNRRRYLPDVDSGNHNLRQFAERAAVNMPIQGTAADIMKLAMIEVQRYLIENQIGYCTLLLQVHDELLFEVETDKLALITPEIVRLMEAAYPPMTVRLRADAKSGPSWAEMHSL